MALANRPQNYGVAVFRFQEHIEINLPMREGNPEIFYYAQVDLIKEANKGKSWKWCKVRPDQIAGAYLYYLGLTMLISPSRPRSHSHRHDIRRASRTLLDAIPLFEQPRCHRRLPSTIHKLHPHVCVIFAGYHRPLGALPVCREAGPGARRGTQHGRQRHPRILRMLWSECRRRKTRGQGLDIDKWWFAHQDDHKKMCEEYGLRPPEISEATWIFLSVGFSFLGRNRELSLDKIQTAGFTEDPIAYGYFQVFDHLAQEKIIPSKEA